MPLQSVYAGDSEIRELTTGHDAFSFFFLHACILDGRVGVRAFLHLLLAWFACLLVLVLVLYLET